MKANSIWLAGLALVSLVYCATGPSPKPRASTGSSSSSIWSCVPKSEESCDQIIEPRAIATSKPFYPYVEGFQRPSGRVVLVGTIETDGSVTDVRKVAADQGNLVPPAVAAVRTWRYQPASCNGRPVKVLLSVVVDFYNGDKFQTKIPRPDCNSVDKPS